MTEPSQYFKGRTVQEQMNEVIGYVDTRAAEVATTAIASDVAQVHQDMLDADADASAAAASAAAAAGTLANAVKKTGEASQSIAGDIAVSGTLSGGVVTGTVITAPAPVNNTDAANKKYVDDADALKADKTYVDAQDALKISITDINTYAVGLTGNQTKTGELTLSSPFIGQQKPLAVFGSNTDNGWYALCKLPKVGRQLVIEVMSPGYYNIATFDVGTNTHNVRAFKTAGYSPNANKFLLAEVSDGYIVYVYSTTYRSNIVKVKDFSTFGTSLNYSTIDTSVFTGIPETNKPAVGGDITGVYDESLMLVVTS